MLRVLDLFSGIGGFSLGLERTGGFRTVAFCEIEPYCRAVLAKHWPGVPIHDDVRTLKGADVGAADVICGGYPCQPFSLAGKRAGEADDRHLWPEYRRLIEELRPTWVLGENVAGHINLGLDSVLSDLGSLGYAWRPFVIPACALDAKHRRDRIWIVAHSRHPSGWSNATQRGVQGAQRVCAEWCEADRFSGERSKALADAGGGRNEPADRCGSRQAQDYDARRSISGGRGEALANSERERGRSGDAEREDAEDARQPSRRAESRSWDVEPDVGRVANGVPSRVDRLRALGNAVVPQIPEIIGRAILAAEGIQ